MNVNQKVPDPCRALPGFGVRDSLRMLLASAPRHPLVPAGRYGNEAFAVTRGGQGRPDDRLCPPLRESNRPRVPRSTRSARRTAFVGLAATAALVAGAADGTLALPSQVPAPPPFSDVEKYTTEGLVDGQEVKAEAKAEADVSFWAFQCSSSTMDPEDEASVCGNPVGANKAGEDGVVHFTMKVTEVIKAADGTGRTYDCGKNDTCTIVILPHQQLEYATVATPLSFGTEPATTTTVASDTKTTPRPPIQKVGSR